MTVSELAKCSKVSADTIRHYTKLGLLTPWRDPGNGYRKYDATAQQRLVFIRRAQLLGFTLSEIRLILDHAVREESPCPEVRRIIGHRIVETRQRAKQLMQMQENMEMALREWDGLPNKTPTGASICHLIETVDLLQDEGVNSD